jgi:hypothetical protein
VKTVKVSGLAAALNWLQPLVKSIANGTVKLADGVLLTVPDETEFGFAATDNPDVIEVTFSGMKVAIDRTSLMGLVHINATEPVTFADVGPQSIETQVSLFRIVAVDDGAGP